MDTPFAESLIGGISVMATQGLRPVAEIQFMVLSLRPWSISSRTQRACVTAPVDA